MIDLSALASKRIAILGLGKTGLSAARAFMEVGAGIAAWDDNEEKRSEASALSVPLMDLNQSDITGFDMLLLSPGIPHSFPEPHPIASKAKAAHVPMICDIDLLCRVCPDADMVCITGTNGKSTTTALIGHILENSRPTQTGGNIGRPVLSLNRLAREGTYVLELSSYQLELSPSLRPVGAVLLNITPDHLDRHGGMDGYISAKKQIFDHPSGNNPIAVIGVDTAPARDIADQLDAEKIWTVIRVSTETELQNGVHVRDGRLYDQGRLITDLKEAPSFKGRHNHENAACAYAVIRYVYGYNPDDIASFMLSFPGLPHRQYPVRTMGGVTYINDSKATNADAAAKALECYTDIYWILGGLPKEGGLNGLEPYMDRIRHAFLIGQAASAFAEWLEKEGVPYTMCGVLENAVAQAHRLAQSAGAGTVLLSPVCASWDQFKSFEHRGDVFTDLVNSLSEEPAS